MNNFLALLFLFVSVLNAYELQKEYLYSDPTIVSTDLFPELPQRFEIVKIPVEKHLYRLDAHVVAKTFELHGVKIDTAGVRYVSFVKKSPVELSPIEEQLEHKFRECYPNLQITSMTITPRGYLEALSPQARGVFESRICQNSSGTFYVLNPQGLRHYLDYSIEAILPVLHTTQKVSRKEALSGFNTLLRPIPLRSFRDAPLTSIPAHPSRFRTALKSATPLTLSQIEKIPLVLKNENVIAEVKNGAVVLEIIATATQEGSLYDIITVQKRDGKRAKAKVIGEKRVELQ